jgi:hypothetical protein
MTVLLHHQSQPGASGGALASLRSPFRYLRIYVSAPSCHHLVILTSALSCCLHSAHVFLDGGWSVLLLAQGPDESKDFVCVVLVVHPE